MIAFGDLDSRRHFRNLALQFGIDYEPFVSIDNLLSNELCRNMSSLILKLCTLMVANPLSCPPTYSSHLPL
jgi:hypothetical protein